MAEPSTTRWNLIADAAAGVTAARDEFVGRYGHEIRAQLHRRWRRTALWHEVDDAVQEVFVECFKPHGVLERADPTVPAGFRALLGAVVRNVALRFEERGARQRPKAVSDDSRGLDQPPAATSVAHPLDREWAYALIREAVEEQEHLAAAAGPKAMLRFRLLELRFHGNRSIAEIAAQWSLAPDHVHHQYAKARHDFVRALMRVLKRRFPAATTAQLEARSKELVQLLRGG